MLRPLILLAIIVALGVGAATQPATAQDQINLTGGWTIAFAFDGNAAGTCLGGIRQTGSDLFAALACTGDTSGLLHGTIDQANGNVILAGTLSGYPTSNLTGSASKDGTTFEGSYSAVGFPPGITFMATRKDQSPSFVDLTGSWDLVLEPLDRGEATAFGDTCAADIEQSLDELTVSLDCEALGTATLSGTINPVTRELNARSPEGSSGGRFFGAATPLGGGILGFWSSHDGEMASSLTATRISGPAGDVNCDARVNSIDATLVLQFDAGLLESLPCPQFGDLNRNQATNSLDAALILQTTAGLI